MKLPEMKDEAFLRLAREEDNCSISAGSMQGVFQKRAVPAAEASVTERLPPPTSLDPGGLCGPEENAGTRQVLNSSERHQALTRAALGPLELWRREIELANQAVVSLAEQQTRDVEMVRQATISVAKQERRQMELARQAMTGWYEQQRREMDLARQATISVTEQQRRQMELARQAVTGWSEQQRREIETMRRETASVADQQRRQMELARQAMAGFEVRFRLPEIAETARLIGELRVGPLSETLRKYAEMESSLQRAMDSMRTPWLDVDRAMHSIVGFTELQGIGHALRTTVPAFDNVLASALRTDLGDWRDRIAWPPEIFRDSRARSDFYAGLGFDHALTDFPRPAFGQSLRIAGLRREPPALVDRYGAPVPPSVDSDEEEGLARTNMAHDWLLRLETQLRRFIDDNMTRAFGSGWPKHRLPKGLYEKWQEKKGAARSAGAREWPLIAYADFTDYEPVICKRDNWREVFASFFNSPESVCESFQRLYPLRLDTMHARPISQDDELLLYVETKRLVKVIIV